MTTTQTSSPLCEPIGERESLVIVFRGSSASGMRRWYDVYVPTCDPKLPLWRITHMVSNECDLAYDDRREALYLNGCGFCGAQEITEQISSKVGRKLTYQQI